MKGYSQLTLPQRHERIYQHIRSDQAEGGTLPTQLRHRLGPKRATTKMAYKSSIPNRVSINERPAIVEAKQRIGDWEVDLMMGRQGGCAIDLSRTKKPFYAHCAGRLQTRRSRRQGAH